MIKTERLLKSLLLNKEMDVEKQIRRRIAVEKWKMNNREYYLKQKRELSKRPSYRERVRDRYRAKRNELIAAGLLPKKPGRPKLYDDEEAIIRRREINRFASARYRARKIFSPLQEKDEYEIETTSSERY